MEEPASHPVALVTSPEITWTNMDFRGKLRTAFSFLTMLTFLLITLQFVLSRGDVADPDIWWHLRNADYLIPAPPTTPF